MIILGIHTSFNGLNHGPSACLMIDGTIVSGIEEERLNRIKTSLGYFPYKAINYILTQNNLKIKDIDYVSTTGVEHLDLKNKIKSCFVHAYGQCPKIKIFNHSESHAYGSYFSSGFAEKKSKGGGETLVISIDGQGDKISTLVMEGKNKKLTKIYSSKYNNIFDSLGTFYAIFTDFLGFTRGEGEYKVMGMSAYGKKKFNLDHLVKVYENPFEIKINKKVICNWDISSTFQPLVNYNFLNKYFKLKKSSDDVFSQHHFDLALSVQKKYEYILLKLIKKFKKNYTNLCLSGGCALNCLANSKLDKEFSRFYVMPASSDRGLSIGAAYMCGVYLKEKVKPLNTMFIGKKYSNNEILKFLKLAKIKFKRCNSVKYAADDLKKNKIVSWFKGKSEFGPRALGGRSILARADISGMKDKINKLIKFREKFRPFAPVILKKFSKKFGITKDYPYMTTAIYPNNDLKKILQEAVHKDGSTRLQTVESKDHPLYELLTEMEKKKLNPVLINTSFNISGEPIVESPQDAIRTFFSCGIDSLYIENFKIFKN